MLYKNPKEKVKLAEKFSKHAHLGKFRKVDGKPFHTHPEDVVKILKKYGYDHPLTICIAYLHDTVEDTDLALDEIRENFGHETAHGVFMLSRNKGKVMGKEKLTREEYKQRLAFARNKVQRIKIADMIDNTKDLINLPEYYVKRKIEDSEKFYIPLGKEIAPEMTKELILNIESYRNKKN
jgi:GTP diphosphokinase / guanosine-3',5'-bis(diphosphate) 3'-diphosphatase